MPSTENYITQAAGDARYQQLGSLGSSNPSTIDPDDAASAGVSSSASRQDHQHPITTGTPANIGLTGVNSESSGTGFARDLHVHAYNPPACRVFHNANQSIAHNTEQTVVFNSERWDTDTMHSTSVNTERITFTTAGLYLVTFSGFWQAAADYTFLYCSLRLNGTTSIAFGTSAAPHNTASIRHQALLSTVYKFAATDYVEVRVAHANSAVAARTLDVFGNASPEFSATWIGVG